VQLSQLHCQDEQRHGHKRGRLVESQPSSAQSSLSKAIVGVVGAGKEAQVSLREHRPTREACARLTVKARIG